MQKQFLSPCVLGLCWFFFGLLHSQSDSILYTTAFYFEDAIGNKDTVYVSGSPYVNQLSLLLPAGSIVTTALFDSVFEVRLARYTELVGVRSVFEVDYTFKHLVHAFDFYETPYFCGRLPSEFEYYDFVIHAKHLTSSYDLGCCSFSRRRYF